MSDIAENPILIYCSHLFYLSYEVYTLNQGDECKSNKNYRILIERGFESLGENLQKLGLDKQDIGNCQFALSAYIDERVLNSTWEGRRQWQVAPLQTLFFGEHSAGEQFFSRLAELRQDLIKNINIVELFYICLQFGFEGVYKIRGLDQLSLLKEDLFKQIQHFRGNTADVFLRKDRESTEAATAPKKVISVKRLSLILLGLIFLIYLSYLSAFKWEMNRAFKKTDQLMSSVERSFGRPENDELAYPPNENWY